MIYMFDFVPFLGWRQSIDKNGWVELQTNKE